MQAIFMRKSDLLTGSISVITIREEVNLVWVSVFSTNHVQFSCPFLAITEINCQGGLPAGNNAATALSHISKPHELEPIFPSGLYLHIYRS